MSNGKAITEDRKLSWLSSFAQAFGGWGIVLGIVTSGFVAINLLRHVIAIGLSKYLEDALDQYQRWYHEPVQWFFGFLHLPRPAHWALDLAALWFLLGCTVLRTLLVARKRAATHGLLGLDGVSKFESETLINLLMEWPVWIAGPVAVLLWPALLIVIFRYSQTEREFGRRHKREHPAFRREVKARVDRLLERDDLSEEDRMLAMAGFEATAQGATLRPLNGDRQFFLQLLAMVAAVAVLLGVSLMAKRYGL